MEETEELWGTQEVCNFFKPPLTYKELKGIAGKGIISPAKYNKWPIPETIQNIAQYWRDKAEDDRVISEKARLTKARADQEEMLTAEMKGILCDFDEVMKAVDDEIAQVRTAIITRAPRTISLLNIPPTAREREIMIRSVLTKELTSISRDTVTKPRKRGTTKGKARDKATSKVRVRRVG